MDQPLSNQSIANRANKTRLTVVLTLSSLLFLGWGGLQLLTPSLKRADIHLTEVRLDDIANTINASGLVIPVHEEQVPSPIQTQVRKVHVKPGQVVQAGELLLELDDSAIVLAIDSLKQQIAQQQNTVLSLTLELRQKQKQLQSEIELLVLDLASAKVQLQRYQKLGSMGIASATDLAAAELAVQRLEIELRQHRETVSDTRLATETNIAGAQLQQSIYQNQLTQQQLYQSQTQVRAPFAGMLSWLLTDEGASVNAGQLVARVSELNNYRVEATVSDFFARYLNTAQSVSVVYNGQTLQGKVRTILPEIQNGTIKLLVDLDQPAAEFLRDKLRVEANIITEQKQQVLVIDNGPAFNGSGRQQAYLVTNNTATRTTLELGLGDGKRVEVLSGAKLGDQIIISDTSQIKHLASISITN